MAYETMIQSLDASFTAGIVLRARYGADVDGGDAAFDVDFVGVKLRLGAEDHLVLEALTYLSSRRISRQAMIMRIVDGVRRSPNTRIILAMRSLDGDLLVGDTGDCRGEDAPDPVHVSLDMARELLVAWSNQRHHGQLVWHEAGNEALVTA